MFNVGDARPERKQFGFLALVGVQKDLHQLKLASSCGLALLFFFSLVLCLLACSCFKSSTAMRYARTCRCLNVSESVVDGFAVKDLGSAADCSLSCGAGRGPARQTLDGPQAVRDENFE